MSEPPARAAHAALDLVEDHQPALACADITHSLEVTRWRNADAAFALYRLEHDRRDVAFTPQGAQHRDVAIRYAQESRRQRPESRLRLGVAGRGERGECPAMK